MKLIRDGIPADMRANGYEPEIVFVRGEALRAQLLSKLIEECNEVVASNGEDASELGDVFAVLTALAVHGGLNYIAAENEKASRLGGFLNGTVWVNSDDRSHQANVARVAYRKAQKPTPPRTRNLGLSHSDMVAAIEPDCQEIESHRHPRGYQPSGQEISFAIQKGDLTEQEARERYGWGA